VRVHHPQWRWLRSLGDPRDANPGMCIVFHDSTHLRSRLAKRAPTRSTTRAREGEGSTPARATLGRFLRELPTSTGPVFHRRRRSARVQGPIATPRPARDEERSHPWNTSLLDPAGLREAVDAPRRTPREKPSAGRWDLEEERYRPWSPLRRPLGNERSPSGDGPCREIVVLRDDGPRGRVRRRVDEQGETQGRIGLLRVATRKGRNGLDQRSKAPRSHHPWMVNDEGAGIRRERRLLARETLRRVKHRGGISSGGREAERGT